MHQICLIEDNIDLQNLVRTQLSAWYQVSAAASVEEGRRLLADKKFDLVLLDVELPDGNGFELCTQLKSDEHTKDIPVIFLTGRGQPLEKMMAFQLGADDYVVKPFEPIEVRARIEARLRARASARKGSESELRAGPLRFDRVRQRAYAQAEAAERDLGLTPLEYKLLYFLAADPGRAYNRVELMKSIQEPGVHVNEENIYTHVCAVRRKLADYASLLECLPRVGYRFAAPHTPAKA